MRRLSPTSRGPPSIILTSLLSVVWLVFPPNLEVFRLHGRVLLATRFMLACCLETTLGVVVRCNTAIRPESIHCMLVTYGVKYVRLLATTLGVAVCCNIAIRLESVHSALMTYGLVFVCCSTTTLGISIRRNTAIRPDFICCVLAIIRFLPICRARLR